MPVKRRNNGRSKKNCGHMTVVRCQNCHRCVPKDKVIKRFTIRNIVDNTIAEDVLGACEVQGFALPKVYNKIQYCVSCALHNHLVHVRSREDRKIRTVPKRFARNSKPVRK